jgi:hypothetical protein
MCHYVGIFYEECYHIRFTLDHFCKALYDQLQRINDPAQREQYALPFDPDIPGCEPYALFNEDGRPVVTRDEPGSGNVLRWMFNLSELCPSCEEAVRG